MRLRRYHDMGRCRQGESCTFTGSTSCTSPPRSGMSFLASLLRNDCQGMVTSEGEVHHGNSCLELPATGSGVGVTFPQPLAGRQRSAALPLTFAGDVSMSGDFRSLHLIWSLALADGDHLIFSEAWASHALEYGVFLGFFDVLLVSPVQFFSIDSPHHASNSAKIGGETFRHSSA